MLPEFKFHHIGYAVESIEKTAAMYLAAGWDMGPEIEDPIQNVRIAFLRRSGTPLIELVAPVNDMSPVVEILRKVGVAPYHVCYEVPDIQDAIARLRKKRFMPLFKPVPAVALDNRLICYLYNKDTGIIEIVE